MIKIHDIPYNHNKHYYWFLISFSLLSILLHLVPSNKRFHNMLYSSNVVSLIGFTIMLWLSPYGFYNTYAETFKQIGVNIGFSRVFMNTQLNMVVFNILAWIFHIIPIIAFRNTYTLENPMIWMSIYLILFGVYLPKIYPYTISTTVMIGIVGLILVCFLQYSRVLRDELLRLYSSNTIYTKLI